MAIKNTNLSPLLKEGANITLTQSGQVITIAANDTTNAPGGSDTQVQFNDGGNFGGDSGLTYNKTTNVLGLESIDFAQTPTATNAERRILWNNDEGTAVLTLKGGNVTIPIGHEVVTLVYNAEATTLTKGTVVYAFGAQGQRISVKRAVNTGDATSAQTIGVVAESIASGAEGWVMVQGMIRGLDTSAYVQGDALYLGATAGTFTKTKPYAPNHLVYVGIIVKVNASSGEIFVKCQNGYEMDELHNVSAQSPSNNDILAYNTSTNLWEKKQLSAISGITGTGTSGQVAFFNGTSSITGESNLFWDSANDRFTVGTTESGVGKIGANSATGQVGFNVGTSSSPERGNIYFTTDGSGWKMNIGKYQSSIFSPIMTIHDSERVSIGTTTDSGYKLDVNGTGRTGTLTINTNGQGRTISTYYGANSDGSNIFIGGGGLSSIGAIGETYKGSNNSALGAGALNSNTTGYFNSAVGVSALLNNTTGYNNSAVGLNALLSNTTGFHNSAVGVFALNSNTTGHSNSAVGVDALFNNTEGNSNTALGFQAGYGTGANANTTGTNNIFIGYQSVGVSATESNRTWIGNSSTVTSWIGGNLLLGSTTTTGERLQVTGSAKITGDLAVDTNTLFVDSANNKVGVGTSSPAYKFDVVGEGRTSDAFMAGGAVNIDNSLAIQITSTGTGTSRYIGINKNNSYGLLIGYNENSALLSGVGAYIRQVTSDPIYFYVNNTTLALTLSSNGSAAFNNTLSINTINNATTDTDKFLVSDSGVIKYRTGSEILSDIGAQAALTNPVTGTGTTNYVPKFTGSTTLGNSSITDDGTNVTFTANNGVVQINRVNSTEIHIRPNAGASGYITFTENAIADRWSIGITNGDGNLYFRQPYQASAALLTLTSGGNLLVGTTTDSGYKLDVNGTIRLQSTTPTFTINRLSGGSQPKISFVDSSTEFAYIQPSGATGVLRYDIGPSSGWGGIHAWYTDTTEKMRITSGGYVGIGTNNPQAMLDVAQGIRVNSAGIVTSSFANGLNMGSWDAIGYNAAGNTVVIGGYRTSQWGAIGFYTSGNEVARINGGNLLVGTTTDSGYKLDVTGTSRITNSDNSAFLINSGATTGYTYLKSSNSGGDIYLGVARNNGVFFSSGGIAYAGVIGTGTNTPLQFGTNDIVRATLDSSGNLGLGVTPSAWDSSLFKAFQIGNRASVFTFNNVTSDFGNNVYYGSGNYRYIESAAASLYRQTASSHEWYTAPSGTAGNGISFTQAMTLDASGNLLLGETSQAYLSRFTLSYNPVTTNGPIFLDNRAFGIDKGGSVWFGGKYNTAGNYRPFGGIAAFKENATDGNSAGYLVFFTNSNGADATDKMKLTSNGDLIIGSGADTGESLQVTGDAKISSNLTSIGTLTVGSLTSGSDATINLATNASGNPRAIIYRSATAAIDITNTAGSTVLQLTNGGNLGLGTSSPYTASGYIFMTTNGTSGSGYVTRTNGTLSSLYYSSASATIISEQRALPLQFETSGITRATLDSSGNLGLGVTPSAWNVADWKTLQVNYGYVTANSSSFIESGVNAYNNGTNYIYIGSSLPSTRYRQNSGNHEWYNAPSGTAGNAITFTQAMTLDASGRLGIGTASPSTKLHVYQSTTDNTAGGRTTPIDVLTLETENTAAVEYDGFGQGIVFRGSTYNNATQRTLGRILHQINDDSINTTRGTSLAFQTLDDATTTNAPTTKLLINYAGNLGLGVTPSAWGGGNVALDMGGDPFSGINAALRLALTTNAYAIGATYYYRSSGLSAQQYRLSVGTGNHEWYVAPSGTAGNTISFTQAMTLDASGRLVVNKTSSTNPYYYLQVNQGISSDTSIVAQGTLTGYSGPGVFLSYETYGGRLEAYDYGTSSYKNVAITPNGGNLLVGTTTDVGFKLDVNGTGRFTANNAALTLISASTTGYSSTTYQADSRTYVTGVGGSLAGVTETRNSYYIYDNTAEAVRLSISSTGAATFSSSVTASSFVKSGGTSTQYLMADGSTSTLTNPVTGTGTTDYVPKFTGSSTIGNSIIRTSGSNTVYFSTIGGAGNKNLFIGTQGSSDANYTTSVGIEALANIGFYAQQNTAFGYQALNALVDGRENVAIGLQSGSTHNSSYNTSVGYGSLTGNNFSGGNTAIGYLSMYGGHSSATAAANTAVGRNSLANSSLTGSDNVAIGAYAGRDTSSGSQNIYIGSAPQLFPTVYNTTGSNNIFIGHDVRPASITESNRVYIGNSSTATAWIGGNLLLGSTTTTGERLQVTGKTLLNGNTTIKSVSNSDDFLTSIQFSTNAQYQTWYASNGTTRRGYFGYPNAGGNNFELLNEANSTLGIGTNGTIHLSLLTTGQLKFTNYTSTTSFTGTAAGVLAFDSSGNILTIATPGGGSGITSLNGLNAATQTFATGTSGTDFNISSVTSTHTFNIPTASATNRGALSSTDWSTFNSKLGGSTGSVDNAILRADGTGGSTAQTSSIVLSDTADLTLGTTSLSGSSRTITVDGSASDVGLNLTTKGLGVTEIDTYNFRVTAGISSQFKINGNGNDVRFPLSIYHAGGSPYGNGRGVGMLFYVDANGVGGSRTAASLYSVLTDFTNGSEDSDFSINLLSGGGSFERLRVLSTGQLKAGGYTSSTSFTGTAAGYLAFDSSGNILSAAVPSSGIGGSTGSTDNAILRADGTGGSTAQASSIILSDNADLTLGTTSLAGTTRTISADSSSANVALNLVSKGTGQVRILPNDGATSDYTSILAGASTTITTFGATVNDFTQATFNKNYIQFEQSSSALGTIIYPVEIYNNINGTPAIGTGVGIEFINDIASGNASTIGYIDFVTTAVGAGTTNTDFVVRGSASSSIAEKFRVKSTGQLKASAYTSSSSFSGTAAGYLAFTSSGDIITTTTPSSTPTYSISTKTSNYTETATSGEVILLGDTTGGTFTITLPTAVSNTAKITIKKIAGSANLTIDGNGSQTIDGGLTADLVRVYESITLVSDNSNWHII